MKHDVEDLLRRAIVSPGNQDLLREVGRKADEILDYLKEFDFPGELRKVAVAADPQWLAELYCALATPDEVSEEDLVTIAELSDGSTEDEKSIGRAFVTLMSDLPVHLQNLARYLHGLKEFKDDEFTDLQESPVVQAGRPFSDGMVLYGMTPLTIYYASEGISMLIDRLMRHHVLQPDLPVIIDPTNQTDRLMNSTAVDYSARTQRVGHQMIMLEIVSAAKCSEAAAPKLFDWLIAVARVKPYLFDGFKADPVNNNAVRITRELEFGRDVHKRWSVTKKIQNTST